MPRIITHAIPLDVVRTVSGPLVDELAALLNISRDHLVLEVRNDPFVQDGAVVSSHPFVEVWLFPRGRDQETTLARALTRHLKAAGCPAPDVAISYFQRERYFEDGEPFA